MDKEVKKAPHGGHRHGLPGGKVVVSAKVHPNIAVQLATLATERGISRSELIEEMVRSAVGPPPAAQAQ